jgi:hypothetical protein
MMMSRILENASTPSIQFPSAGQADRKASLLIVGFTVMLSISSGCSALVGRTKGPLDNLDTSGLKQAGYTFGEYGANKTITTDDGKPAIVLEVNNGKRHFEKIPLVPGQSMFIADLVRDAKLQKKIGKIKVTVLRPNGVNQPPVRLDVDFDDSGKHVMEGQNYSLRAGDHVIVLQDDRSFLTAMVPELPFMKR